MHACTHTQSAILQREGEIARLGTRAGVDPSVLALQQRSESHEEMILQLNQTVGHTSAPVHTSPPPPQPHVCSGRPRGAGDGGG
jgi:hypothetical protein